MKRKIISKISYGYVAISTIAVPWLTLEDLRFLPTCIWGLGLMVATAGMFFSEEKETEKEIKQENRKFYNFKLSNN